MPSKYRTNLKIKSFHARETQLPLAPIVKISENPVIRMEATDNLTFLRSLEDGSMKLIVTSPPYNIGKKYEKRTPLEGYLSGQAATIAECVRVLHPKGSLCWQVGNHVGTNGESGEVFPLDILLYPIFKQYGLKLRNRIIWHFEHGLHCINRLSGRHETILWFTKSDNYTFNLYQ